jgi:hypothetical protein
LSPLAGKSPRTFFAGFASWREEEFRAKTQSYAKGFWLPLAGSNSGGPGTAFRPTTHSYTTNQSAVAENGKNNFP